MAVKPSSWNSPQDSPWSDSGEGRSRAGLETLPVERLKAIHRVMTRARVMEERMIKMSKSGQAYFWVGGPGEEAFNVPLGMQAKRGKGPDFDYLHLHYRSSATMLAMGMAPEDAIRQMAMRVTDPFSMGRNFVGHFARRDWNVTPVFSVIENQYVIAIGTAMVQKRHGGDGVTIVTGGDAGTAEGDYTSCLTWATRPGNELPILVVVTDNAFGISTPTATQMSHTRALDLAKAHGIPGEIVNGKDPVASWHAIARGLDYCRRERGPYMLLARVSRMYGHSSSSGATRVEEESDPLRDFESRLLERRVFNEAELDAIHREESREIERAVEQVLSEPHPGPSDLYRHVYAPSPVDQVYPDDYHGLPG